MTPCIDDQLEVCRHLLREIAKLDKCPLCGDNDDHHLSCAVYRAQRSLEKRRR